MFQIAKLLIETNTNRAGKRNQLGVKATQSGNFRDGLRHHVFVNSEQSGEWSRELWLGKRVERGDYSR